MATAGHHDPAPHDPALARRLILEERFVLSLHQALQSVTKGRCFGSDDENDI